MPGVWSSASSDYGDNSNFKQNGTRHVRVPSGSWLGSERPGSIDISNSARSGSICRRHIAKKQTVVARSKTPQSPWRKDVNAIRQLWLWKMHSSSMKLEWNQVKWSITVDIVCLLHEEVAQTTERPTVCRSGLLLCPPAVANANAPLADGGFGGILSSYLYLVFCRYCYEEAISWKLVQFVTTSGRLKSLLVRLRHNKMC